MEAQHTNQTPLERVLERLDGVRGQNGGYKALCPAHDDHDPSLGVKEGDDGRALLKCHAGCPVEDVLDAIGLQKADLFTADNVRTLRKNAVDAVYDYRDAAGDLVHQTVRYKPKDFRQRRPDGKGGYVWSLQGVETVLYRLPEVLKAAESDRVVLVVEGEQDADNAHELGVVATTCPMGAKKFRESHAKALAGAHVVFIPDNDTPGRDHVKAAAALVAPVAASVKVVELPGVPESGDLSDWIAAGGTKEQLRELVREAEPFEVSGEEAAEPERGQDVQDVGITKLLADTILDADYFALDAGGKLYHFSGGAYRNYGERFIKQRVLAILEGRCEAKKWSSHRANEVVEYIRVKSPELWERPPVDVVNVQNGLLNVLTRELSDHSPTFLSTVQLPVDYDPSATCPAWDAFVETTFPEDALQLAYEIPADLMAAERSEQKSILLLGEGANGKSTYLTAAAAFIGSTNIVGISLQKLESDRFSAARLMGRLANICPDLPSSHLTGTSMFKAVTGGDAINAEYKYRDSFEFRPFARLVFSANHVPRSEDASHAFFRRWLVVPFSRTFEGTEAISREELDARLSDPRELSGVLNKALEALPGLRKKGFTESPSMREAWAEFRTTTDPVSVWLDKSTVEAPDAVVAKADLLAAYNADCEKNGRAGMTSTAFGLAVKRVRPGLSEAQRTVNGKPKVKVWAGIGLKVPDPDGDNPPPDPPDRGETSPASPGSPGSPGFTNCYLYENEPDKPEVKEEETLITNNRENPVNPVNHENGARSFARTPEEERSLEQVRAALERNAPIAAVKNWREKPGSDERFSYVVNAVMNTLELPREAWPGMLEKYAPLVRAALDETVETVEDRR